MNQSLVQANLIAALTAALQPQLKHDNPTGVPSVPYYHGPAGLFSGYGMDRDLISTRVHPVGIADRIPARSTVYTDPLYAFITGFQAGTGSEKDDVCDVPPVGGPVKSCKTTAVFGRFERMTRELEVNRIGQLTDRSELMDLRLLNEPLLSGQGGMSTPDVPGSFDPANEVRMRMMELGVSFQNLISPKIWTGNPANNTAGGGYKEFPGLDILVGTGKVDAETGTSCPSLDSLIRNYNYGRVDGTPSNSDIVAWLTYMLRYLNQLADTTNMAPVKFVIVMRPGLFYELTAVWPCSYMTYRCIERITGSVTFDAGDAIAMRDAMRTGKYLVIDGEQVEVVVDNSIPEESSGDTNLITNGNFASDLYILPMTVRGGDFASLYWEYLDYSKVQTILAAGPLASNWFWSDGGRWFWTMLPPKVWCIQWVAKTEPRIILRTPHLAARLTNIQYSHLIHERDPFPTDDYFVNGGVTSRAGPSYYNEW